MSDIITNVRIKHFDGVLILGDSIETAPEIVPSIELVDLDEPIDDMPPGAYQLGDSPFVS